MKRAVAQARELLRQGGGPDEGQGRARHGLRRRARHRQEPRQHDPLQQRLHDLRPGPAGADPGRSSTRPSRSAPTRSASRRCSSRPRSRCRSACTSSTRAGSTCRCWSAARRSTARSAGASTSSRTARPTSPASSTARTRSRAWRWWSVLARPRRGGRGCAPQRHVGGRVRYRAEVADGPPPPRPPTAPAGRADLPRVPVPAPPFLGARVGRRRPGGDVLGRHGHEDRSTALAGAARTRAAPSSSGWWRRTSSRAACACRRRALRDGWLVPRAGLRLLPRCAADGEDAGRLRRRRRAASSGASRSRARRRTTASAIADYFRTVDDDERDVVRVPGRHGRARGAGALDRAAGRRTSTREAYFAHGMAIAADRGPGRGACTGASSASSGSARARAGATRGATRPARTSTHHALVLRPAGRAGGDRHRADVGVPARSRAVDGGASSCTTRARSTSRRCAPSARARSAGNLHADGYRIVPAASPDAAVRASNPSHGGTQASDGDPSGGERVGSADPSGRGGRAIRAPPVGLLGSAQTRPVLVSELSGPHGSWLLYVQVVEETGVLLVLLRPAGRGARTPSPARGRAGHAHQPRADDGLLRARLRRRRGALEDRAARGGASAGRGARGALHPGQRPPHRDVHAGGGRRGPRRRPPRRGREPRRAPPAPPRR